MADMQTLDSRPHCLSKVTLLGKGPRLHMRDLEMLEQMYEQMVCVHMRFRIYFK